MEELLQDVCRLELKMGSRSQVFVVSNEFCGSRQVFVVKYK